MSDYTEHLITMAGGDGDVSSARVHAAMKAHLEAPRTRGLDTTGPMRAALAASDAVMFSDTAVEQAAKALCAAEFPEVSPTYAWNVQFEDGQRHYRELARTAIRAALTATEGSKAVAETDQELHAARRHPLWEYATTEGQRKSWDDADTPPDGDGWERNTDAGRNGWDRFDYTEESYWRRLRPGRGGEA